LGLHEELQIEGGQHGQDQHQVTSSSPFEVDDGSRVRPHGVGEVDLSDASGLASRLDCLAEDEWLANGDRRHAAKPTSNTTIPEQLPILSILPDSSLLAALDSPPGGDATMVVMNPADDPLMSIGLFSRASLVSIKALRLYHEQGLLVPAEIDATTGYRSYRVSQLADAQVIKRLRDLDISLRDVARIVSSRDPEITRAVIAQHEQAVRLRLAELTRIVDDLQLAVAHPSTHTPVHVRTDPPMHVLSITSTVIDPSHDTFAAFLNGAYGAIWSTIARLGAIPAGPSGALYPAEVGADTELVVAFMPIAEPLVLDEAAESAGLANLLVPEVTSAVLSHVGAYADLGIAYRQLGAWVVRHARSAETQVRELYVVSVDETGVLLPDDQLRTEIVWPLLPPYPFTSQES
jgi:DNA-binding transcriptional MerR regulator